MVNCEKIRLMLVGITSIFFSSSCVLQKKASQKPVEGFAKVKFLDMYFIPNRLTFEKTKVGGLSSIDYNSQNDEYYLVCDDRSAINPARFYTAKIDISNNKLSNFKITRVDSLRDENGKLYQSMAYFENHPDEKFNTPDAEELRYYAPKSLMVWSSEGERIIGAQNLLLNPSITVIQSNGKWLRSLPIPKSLEMTATNYGPRKNGVIEGLSFSPNFKTLFASVEEPLLQDGQAANIEESKNTWCRILKYDFNQPEKIQQFAYPLGKVIRKPIPFNSFKINGISSILSIDEYRLLVVERSFSMGHLQSNVRVYLTDLKEATPLNETDELLKMKDDFIPAKKELVINFDTLGVFIDNVEGITFGPKLANGHQTLLFVTDNNFNKIEKQQIFLFELIP